MTPEETPKDSMPTPPPADKGSGETPPEKPNKSRPVKVYLIALFCVALLLLLVSFVMQQRNHSALQDLNDSISNNQAVADLQLENQRLQYELEERKNQEEDLQSQVEEKDKQIEAAVRSSYSEAKTMIEAFEETGLEESLPTESTVEGAESPADAYRTIYAMFY